MRYHQRFKTCSMAMWPNWGLRLKSIHGEHQHGILFHQSSNHKIGVPYLQLGRRMHSNPGHPGSLLPSTILYRGLGDIRPHSCNSAVRLRPQLFYGAYHIHRCEAGVRRFVKSALSTIHPAILSPLVFVGLVVTLWAYKCLMMIIFQNKIIYMPGVPLGARRETISDYEGMCSGFRWRQVRIPTADGKVLGGALCEVTVGKAGLGEKVPGAASPGGSKNPVRTRTRVLIVYLQGNASSTPPRLPMLSSVLKGLSRSQAPSAQAQQHNEHEVVYTIFAPSYRGYWTSSGRPSQRGIEEDGRAIFKFLGERGYEMKPAQKPGQCAHAEDSQVEENLKLVIWGQSIGANIAMTTLANHLREEGGTRTLGSHLPRPAAVILETPFLSIPAMLIELYPQKWLPYRYLTPFLRNWWDLEDALSRLRGAGFSPQRISIILAERDELVGREQGARIEELVRSYLGGGAVQCGGTGEDAGRKVTKVIVKGALHVECLVKQEGMKEVIDTIREVTAVGQEGTRRESMTNV